MRAIINPMGLVHTTLVLPAYWASALVNGDFSGLEDSATEIAAIREVEQLFGACVGASDTPFFQMFHDASGYGVLGGDVLTFAFLSDERRKS